MGAPFVILRAIEGMVTVDVVSLVALTFESPIILLPYFSSLTVASSFLPHYVGGFGHSGSDG